eukprot:73249_1
MSDDTFVPQIEAPWILAMIICGFIGFILHVIIVAVTSHHYFAIMDSRKGLVFIVGCILLLCFNMLACLLWAVARTNIIIPLSVTACKFIYASNFLSYFIAKYILHCLLIFRIYMTFRGSALEMPRRSLVIFLTILSVNFFVAMSVWTISIAPSVLQGQWTVNGIDYRICTLFSDENSSNVNVSVKLCAVTIGIEDFIVGTITLWVFLTRFRHIAKESQETELFEASTRFGVASFFSVISTLFLFTLSIPFYPNMTFVLAIDATINSLCLFCVLSVGQDLYWYVCAPCRISGHRWFTLRRMYPDVSSTQLAAYFVQSQQDLETMTCPLPADNKTKRSNSTSAPRAPAEIHNNASYTATVGLNPVAHSLLIKCDKSNTLRKAWTDRGVVVQMRPLSRLHLTQQSSSAPVPSTKKNKRNTIGTLKKNESNPNVFV